MPIIPTKNKKIPACMEKNSMRNEHFCIGSVLRVVVSFVFMNSFFLLEIPFLGHHDSFFWSHKVDSSG